MRRSFRLLLGLVTTVASPALAAPSLAPIWGDGAIIQRGRPIVIEGKAEPGEKITVTLDTTILATVADKTGRFSAQFPARSASAAPITLTFKGKNGEAITYTDVLVGDVWLCSGQSNMEFTVDHALDIWSQINASSDDGLRMLTVQKAVSDQPLDHFEGSVSWKKAGPQTTGSFSAACYFMLKEIKKRSNIPQGAIHASWGGSASRPWLSDGGARAIYGTKEMDLLHLHTGTPAAAMALFAPRWEEWHRTATNGSQPWAAPDSINWLAVPKMSAWNDWQGTPLAENPSRMVWLRRSVDLTAEEAKGAATLTLGTIDDLDTTWINGQAVGNSFGWDFDRIYSLPMGTLKAGRNEIIIAASNSWGTGGLTSSADKLALKLGNGTAIALNSGWKYSISPQLSSMPRAPWDRQSGIGVMHNAMVAPIGHFALAGVAWYQGESDVGTPGYAERLKALFAGWREQFGLESRMLVVQLANYGSPQIKAAASGWAELREAQRQGVIADRNAALVTAIDLGDRTDIHPANKNELGRRLAAAALGDAMPQPISAVREAGAVRLRFSGIQGGLTAWSSAGPISFELCGADQSSCHFVSGRIEGDSIVLPDTARAARVRYAWGDSPVVNTYDARPMPLPGFELLVTDK